MNLLEKLSANLNEIVANVGAVTSNSPLSDESSLAKPISLNLPRAFELPIATGSILTLDVEANSQIQLFNNLENDESDPSGLLQKENSFILFNPECPVLKYQLGFKLGESLQGSVGSIGFGIKSNAEIDLLSYRIHDQTEFVQDAILHDVQSMPLIFIQENVTSLKENECVAYNCYGKIAMQLGFSISDILLSCIPALKSYFKLANSTIVDLAIGDKVDLMYSIEDTFNLAISKIPDNKYKVSIKKSKVNTENVNYQLGINLSLKNPDNVKDYLSQFSNKFLESVSGLSIVELSGLNTKIDQYIADATNALNAEELDMVKDLLQRFNINIVDEVDKLKELVQKIKDIKNKLQISRIDELINQAQVKLSFIYEYQRIDSDEEILKAEFSELLLRQYYDNLLKLDTTPIVDDPNARKQITEYLRTEVEEKVRKWGFNLGIGNLNITTTNIDNKKLNQKTQTKLNTTNNDLYQKIVYEGLRKHEFKNLFNDRDTWQVDFKAEMEKFSQNPYPQISFNEFDFGLTLIQNHTEKKYKKHEKDRFMTIMNTALIWDIIPNLDFRERCDKIWKIINFTNDCTNIEISMQFQISNISIDLANRIKSILDDNIATLKIFARAFARMLPYIEDTLREDVNARTDFYSKYWYTYLEGRVTADKEYCQQTSEKIIKDLNSIGQNTLAGWEGSYAETKSFYQELNYLGTTSFVDNPYNQVDNFKFGFGALVSNIINNQYYQKDQIEDSYIKMKKMWLNSDSALALGAFFIEVTKDSPIFQKDFKKIIDIKYTDSKGNQKKLSVS